MASAKCPQIPARPSEEDRKGMGLCGITFVQRGKAQVTYIDPQEPSSSTLRVLVWRALKGASIKGLITLLKDTDVVVRTIAARELQLRGGPAVWRLCLDLCKSRQVGDRVLGLFILAQLGSPKLPYRQESLQLIKSMLPRERSLSVVEQAFYAIGHLRKGKPISDHELESYVSRCNVRRGSALAEAKKFALHA
jgi:hypothetical protein